MKILYIFLTASKNPNSVQNKVLEEIKGLIANGVSCEALFFSTDHVNSSDYPDYIRFVQVPKLNTNYFRSSQQKSKYFESLISECYQFQNNYDYIYFRYPGAHSLLLKWIKKCKIPVFFEHVTAELEEIKLYKNENQLRLNVSSVLSYFEFYFLPLYKEWRYGSKIRQKATFGICNSNDIEKHELKIAKGKYKTLILGDAVNTKDFQIKEPLEMKQELRMVFLKGAGTRAEYNGLDRVFKGLSNYKGIYHLKFYLYGKNLDYERTLQVRLTENKEIIFGSFVHKVELDDIFNHIHIGIGQLAIHRKGLSSNSTIKTREYFARGLPFIFAHHDPDFSDSPEAMQFCKQLEANDEPLNFEEVIDWYQKLNYSSSMAQQMHHFSELNLDYKVKMKKLILFLNGNLNA